MKKKNNSEEKNCEDPELSRTFKGHRGTITGLSFAPDMKQLASSSMDSSVMLWNFKPTLRAFKYIGHDVSGFKNLLMNYRKEE